MLKTKPSKAALHDTKGISQLLFLLSFFQTTLLKCILYIINSTLIVCILLIFSNFPEWYGHHHKSVLEHFHPPNNQAPHVHIQLNALFHPQLQAATMVIHFLTLQIFLVPIFLFWIVIQYEIFCVWRLSLSKMFMRFIKQHVSVSVPFYYQIVFHFMDIPHFVHPFISGWIVRLFPTLGYYWLL